MPVTFSQAKNALADISLRIDQERSRMAQGKAAYTAAAGVLAGMPAQYAAVIAAIDAAPNTIPYDQLKAEKTALVSEFQALQASADATVAAINAVP